MSPLLSARRRSSWSERSTWLTRNISTRLAVCTMTHSPTPGIFLNSSAAASTSSNMNFASVCMGTFLNVTLAFTMSESTLHLSDIPSHATFERPPLAVLNTFIPR